jgi:hypothetical protein
MLIDSLPMKHRRKAGFSRQPSFTKCSSTAIP